MQGRLTRGSRQLQPLSVGDCVLVQDQYGKTPRQWSQTGIVVEIGSHDSYTVSMGGSRRLTRRNRQFLRKITPHKDSFAKSDVTTVQKPQLSPRMTSSHYTTPPPAPMQAPVPVSRPTPLESLSNPVPDAPILDTDSDVVRPAPCDGAQSVPPVRLRRSGPDDRWTVAGQRFSSQPSQASGTWTLPGPLCMGHVWSCGSGFAPTSSCPTHLPRFG